MRLQLSARLSSDSQLPGSLAALAMVAARWFLRGSSFRWSAWGGPVSSLCFRQSWHAPLPNGYQVMMIDVTDQGWVYNPKTQIGSGIFGKEDAVSGVRNLQVAGRYILGATDSKAFEHAKRQIRLMDTSSLILSLGSGPSCRATMHCGAKHLNLASSRDWNRSTRSTQSFVLVGST